MKRKAMAGLLPEARTLAAELPEKAGGKAPAALAAGGGYELLIEGVVGWDFTAASVRAALREVPGDAPLTLRVNSPGGLATEGFAIFNLLAQRAGQTTARVDGVAMSAASYIIMAADRIEVPEASIIMIHNSSCLTWGTKEDHDASRVYLAKIDAIMGRIYAARTGKAAAEISAMLDAETYMDGREAVEAGFADALVELAPSEAATALRLPQSLEARAVLAGFKAVPPRLAAAMAQQTSAPPRPAAPPPEEIRMPPVENQPGGAPVTAAPVPPTPPAQPAPASAAELAAVAVKAGLDPKWIGEQAEAKATLAEAQSRALDAVAARQAGAVTPSGVTVTRDEGDTRRQAAAHAFAVRAGLRVTDAERAQAAHMSGWSLFDFARSAVSAAGGRPDSAPRETVARAALGIREAMASVGMHTTSDFPNLVSNIVGRTLRDAYQAAPRTFTAFSRRATVNDFKPVTRVTAGGPPQLLPVNENGEYEFGTLGDGAESYRATRFGRRIGFSYELIVNDDLDSFTRLIGQFGSAASRLESDTVYGILNSNPLMADNQPLFSAAHNNVGTGALGVTSLGNGRTAMRKQTAPNGEILNLMPATLLVPPELETAADNLLVQTVVPNQAGTAVVNPLAGRLAPVSDGRLVSATQWYLFASPAAIDTIEYAYMAGMEEPRTSTYTDEATDGLVAKCAHIFGAKAIDWRGAYRSSGV